MQKSIIVKVFVTCFFSEMIIMMLVSQLELGSLSVLQEALIDSVLLSTIISTVLYVLNISAKQTSISDIKSQIKIKSNFRQALLIPTILSFILFTISILQLVQLNSLKADLNEKLAGQNIRKELIHNIFDAFGYGGFIHNFKNYLLRGELKYYQSLLDGEKRVLKLLDDYDKLITDNTELNHTRTIRDGVNKYASRVEDVETLRKDNKLSVKEIDKIVRINDENYIKSFAWIKSNLEANRVATLSDINETFDHMINSFILSLVSSISFIFFISFISNKKLMEARRVAEKFAMVRSEFLANMSHEIRTPMNGILGMIQLLDDTKLDPEQKDMLETAHSCGDSLLTILNDILDVSKIEYGKLELEITNFSLKKCIEEALYLSSAKASEKGVSIRFEGPNEDELWFYGDITRIRQILINFLSNAVKFTKDGDVTVYANANKISETEAMVDVKIVDTGIGISAQNLDKLFKDFSQADASTTRKFGGTGLGLAICKKLAELMGGEVYVMSEIGVGSTFGFKIPLKYGHADTSSIGTDKVINGNADELAQGFKHQILLVEDNKVNQKLASMMFKRLGYECDIAENGEEALAAIEKKNFTIIFMDIQMPLMDGFETTENIIKRYGDMSPPIVAMTANAFHEDKENCFKIGMVDFVAKPMKLKELKRVLVKFSNK